MSAEVPDSPEGLTFRPGSAEELVRIIDEAFDYRGDVSLHLHSGERVEGFVFNRHSDARPPFLNMYLKGVPAARRILYSEIAAISFTGEDTASGRDWEAWVQKKESERKAEAERVEAAARARGHL